MTKNLLAPLGISFAFLLLSAPATTLATARQSPQSPSSRKQAVTPSSTRPSWVPSDWQKCPGDGESYHYAPACPTTARVIGIKRAVITEPGFTVEDYATCIKPLRDLPDYKGKEKVLEEAEILCKQKSELGIPPGYYPPKKMSGYMVTFETPTATYVVSTTGPCGHLKPNGECSFDSGSGVAIGQKYDFTPPGADETRITVEDPPSKDDPSHTRYVRLTGQLESVVEKKRSE